MAHVTSPTAEAILDQYIPCLNHGFVRLVDYNGGDSRIVQSARVSYGEGTKTVREDRGLINYLVKNRHTSPLEQVSLTFHCKMPIFVARQWVRHRTAKLNEISGRYSVMRDEFYVPDPAQICYQATDNKQGRQGQMTEQECSIVIDMMTKEQEEQYARYTELVELGTARELARIDLPLSLYTEWYWQIDLHNLFHFLSLRLDAHAQYEIRVYAEAMAECAKAVAPMAYGAFEEHILHAETFSRTELRILADFLDRGDVANFDVEAVALQGGINVAKDSTDGLNKRDAAAFAKKIQAILNPNG